MQRIALVALAKDPMRLGALVGLRLVVGVVASVMGIAARGEGSAGTVLLVGGAVVTAYAVLLGPVLFGLRMEVFAGQVHLVGPMLRWPFHLAPGSVTRWPPGRTNRCAPWVRGFGVRLGLAAATDEESGLLWLAVLAPRQSGVAVPTTEGRLVVNVPDEGRLMEALRAATSG